MVKVKVTLPRSRLTSSSSHSLDKRTPSASPPSSDSAALISASQSRMRPMLRLPMPSMLYRPNSRLRRRIRKECE